MQSVPLWMQLLAVLLLTWLLTEPRYQRPRSIQRVAVVLDSSASMSVFKDATLAALREKLPPLQGAASAIEFTVLESTPGRPRLFAGDSIDRLIDEMRERRQANEEVLAEFDRRDEAADEPPEDPGGHE